MSQASGYMTKLIAAAEKWEDGDRQPMFAFIKENRERLESDLRGRSAFRAVYSPGPTEPQVSAFSERPEVRWDREQIEANPRIMDIEKAVSILFQATFLMSEQPTLASTVRLPLSPIKPTGEPN